MILNSRFKHPEPEYQGLTLQNNNHCVTDDTDCCHENQNGKDVGADGIRQL